MARARDHEALLALLERCAHLPFSWRSQDCVRFVAAAVFAQTGRRVLNGLRWSSKKRAAELLAAEGGMVAAVDRRLRRIPLAHAARGDIVGVPDAEFDVRLMVLEGRTLAGPGTSGLQRLPRASATIAWSADEDVG